MAEQKRFYCLRCQQRFDVDFDPKKIVERSCPSCGSNSVRAETALSAKVVSVEGGISSPPRCDS